MKIKRINRMDFQLQVLDPFIVCFHHKDDFPKGNDKMEPIHNLTKNVGEDFDPSDPWRMYYGHTIPGFPVHPHRGFETITVVMKGYADHFDSLGSHGRYGEGDVQWMTAGAGVQHSEMFPLLKQNENNPLELFQIWLNLPRKSKFAKPDYKMFWNEDIPIIEEKDINGRITSVRIIAGEYNQTQSLDPLPDSWAYDRRNKVRILIIEMQPEASFSIPKGTSTMGRMLYHYDGESMTIEGEQFAVGHFAELQSDEDIILINGKTKCKLLLMEGEPIGETVAAQGPFVMNTVGELKEAYIDYQKTQFGGWPWMQDDPVNDREADRFASYDNGKRIDRPRRI